jgi:hypothetical protein
VSAFQSSALGGASGTAENEADMRRATRDASCGYQYSPRYEREGMQMAESKPVPIDSLNSILAYLDIERRCYEDNKDDKQFDRVFGHATKVREWLSSLDMSKPGLVVVIREPDDTEIDPTGHS